MALTQVTNKNTQLYSKIKSREEKKTLESIFEYAQNPMKGGNFSGDVQWWIDKPQPMKWPNEGKKGVNNIVLKGPAGAIDDIKIKYKHWKLKPKILNSTNDSLTVQIGVQPVKFEATGKVVSASGKKVDEATLTRMQELGSLHVFKKAIDENCKWADWKALKGDPKTMPGLVKIWRDVGNVDYVGDDWIQNFWKQNAVLITKVGHKDFTDFNREGGFMDWVSKNVRKWFKISKKDNWNPADIWLINREEYWKKKIEDAMEVPRQGPKYNQWGVDMQLNQFNGIMRELFHRKQIWGISLKKVSGDEAKWQEINIHWRGDDWQKIGIKDVEAMKFDYHEANCNCNLKTLKDGTVTLGTQDSRIFIKGAGTTFNFQIKSNKGSGFGNLKYEPTDTAKGAARLGKATAEHVENLLISYRCEFDKSHDNYPETPEEFEDEEKKWKSKLLFLKNNGVNEMGEVQQAFDNILFTFTTQPWVANSKLMQIAFLCEFLGLSNDERDKFGTDMVFIAQKMGRRYGPFAKIS